MLWGALLTVRRMVKRPLPEGPALRRSSLVCLDAAWPMKADCWMADVAMLAMYVLYDVCDDVMLCLWWWELREEGLVYRREGGCACDIVDEDFYTSPSSHWWVSLGCGFSSWFFCLWIVSLILPRGYQYLLPHWFLNFPWEPHALCKVCSNQQSSCSCFFSVKNDWLKLFTYSIIPLKPKMQSQKYSFAHISNF